MKSFIKKQYYSNPKSYNFIKPFLDIYYKAETFFIPDSLYYKKRYKIIFEKELDFDNPTSFNEKINWLKLNNRSKAITTYADKYLVRNYISKKLNTEEYLIPLVFVTENYEDITKSRLPDFPVIIKANHYSSEVHIIRDKSQVDFDKIQFDCKRWLNHNFYYREREWQYKDICRKILVEKLITDSFGNLPNDYKFHCFNGEIELIQLDVERETSHKRNLYDANFNYLDLGLKFQRGADKYAKPENFEKMKNIAQKLSKDFPYVRVDLYNVEGKIYFGELTFTPGAGLEKFSNHEWDLRLGKKLQIQTI